MGTVSRVMAGCFAMSAFAVAIASGLGTGNPATMILGRALIAMMICYPVGLVIGVVCERVIAQHMADYQQQRPLPTDEDDENETDGATESPKQSQEANDMMVV